MDYKKTIQEVIDKGEIKFFAYEGCHKIYLLENKEQLEEAEKYLYNIFSIDSLLEIYEDSCSLRFINFWDLNKPSLIPQC